MKHKSKSQEIFNEKYQRDGMQSQRKYPSEAAVRYLSNKYGTRATNQDSPIVLDIGCGSGSNMMMLLKEGFNVIGLDSSTESLRMARSLCTSWGLKLPTLVSGSFLNVPLSNNSIDCIIDIVSIQHLNLEEASLALKEMSRVLKPKGSFFSYRLSDKTSFHSAMKHEAKWVDSATVANIPQLYPLGDNGPTGFWNEDRAISIYLEFGLVIEEITYVSRSYAKGHEVVYMEISSFKQF
jgi:SAM-dependent methyltransferase